ncbi:carbohydrate esterase family 1 protein [Piromyces sp. E2]|nr:carbohydrate esterase family 1 protein [Piromyces sp. E2]|eukprot:OUM62891.1 carbohydrate esterase family 1 protein [Piromyces sp. E2]
MRKHLCWSLALSLVTLTVTSSNPIKLDTRSEKLTYGITLRDTTEKFTIFEEGSVATDIVQADDDTISWVATASGGAGGGIALYLKSNKNEINIANYESVDLEFDYSPVEGKWNDKAKDPGFCLRLLPWDSTGMFGGFEDVDCFETGARKGSIKTNVKFPADLSEKVIKSSDFDSILALALKFNDYLRDNDNGDQLKVTLKNVTFHPKKDAAEDKKFDDGLKDSERGIVKEIYYPSQDYTVKESDLTDADHYKKHAWVYLPAGYDASDKDTKYPLFVLLHGGGQNENSWGLSDQGRGGKIKGYMDRGMASGDVEKFVLVVVNGVSSKNWGPNGNGLDGQGMYAFGKELRNDILPYMRANYNIKEGRDNVALSGLSMGAGQTYNIGIGECLDLISYFAGLSGGSFDEADVFLNMVDSNKAFDGLKIHTLYATYGDQDFMVMERELPKFLEAIKDWDRIEIFKKYVYPGGTHDFPVWYKGFKDFIPMIFKTKAQEQPIDEQPVDDPKGQQSEVEVEQSIVEEPEQSDVEQPEEPKKKQQKKKDV